MSGHLLNMICPEKDLASRLQQGNAVRESGKTSEICEAKSCTISIQRIVDSQIFFAGWRRMAVPGPYIPMALQNMWDKTAGRIEPVISTSLCEVLTCADSDIRCKPTKQSRV